MFGFIRFVNHVSDTVRSGCVRELLYCSTFPLESACIYSLWNKTTVSCTFLPVFRITSIYLSVCVDILLCFCFNALLSAQLFTVLLHPPPNFGFNFLYCDCFYLYIDGFYIQYVLDVVSCISVFHASFQCLPCAATSLMFGFIRSWMVNSP